VKVLCPECERLISLERFRLDGAALVVTCGKCGAESRVEPAVVATAAAAPVPSPSSPPRGPAPVPRVSLASTAGGSNVVVLRTAGHEAVQKAAASADGAPFAIPDGVCPKCIARRSSAPECPHCGIRFENFDEATVLPVKWLRDEWVELLRDWGNEAKHALLRRKAQQVDALAAVARLYRLRQSAVPEDPVAAEGLNDILRLAAVPIGLPRPQEDLSERRRAMVLGSIVLLVAIALGVVLLRWALRPA